MRFVAFFSCLAAAPLLMAAAQPVRLQPSGPWMVDYAENSCRLIRTFGEGGRTVVFALESESPDQVDMLLVGNPLHTDHQEVPTRFLPVQGKPMNGTVANSTKGPAVVVSSVDFLPDEVAEKIEKKVEQLRLNPALRPPPLDLAEEAQTKARRLEFASKATEFEIDARRSRPVILETGSLGAAVKMFDKCSRDSLRDWGVDPDIEDKIVRPVWAADPHKWLTSDDYPPEMLRRGQESDVKVRLLVDATGKVTKCTSLSHYQETSFNEVVCDKFMKRAHFEPAELADGTKVPSFYTNHIVFRME
ncbi:MAG: energy transducer TonB [Sphingomicrobium sp.]